MTSSEHVCAMMLTSQCTRQATHQNTQQATRKSIQCVISLVFLLVAFQSGLQSTAYAANNQDGATKPNSTTLATLAEQSGYQKTGRYDEVIRLCHAFELAYPKQVHCIQFGQTPEGRPMLALVVSDTGAHTAAEAKRRAIPVVLVQGGIHAGEIDGKDAGFLSLRELLENKVAPGALKKQIVLFVPVFNIDGHERFGHWNRPNQNGPEEMGWRTTAQNINLNRDYVKADAPEMQAMLNLVNEWDPLAYIDLHVTDGAKFQHDISIQVEPVHSGDAILRQAGKALRDNVLAELTAHGSKPLPFYPSFIVEDDPSSGFADGVPTPRFSHGYFWLRNRFGMLVETHSWKDYPTRVRITHTTINAILGQVAEHGANWLQLVHEADKRSAQLAGQQVALSFKNGPESHQIDFQGYRYTRENSAISGALMTRYDDHFPQIWQVPLYDQIVADLNVTAPSAGYFVPAAHAFWVAQKLNLHGIQYRYLKRALPHVSVETFRADSVKFNTQPNEGHQMVQLEGGWKKEERDLIAGTLFIPIAQAKARLVMVLLEPQSNDSLAGWGEFNQAFEQKEYMEDYVAEEVASAQLAADPQLLESFNKRLAQDSAFAHNPAARLQFFARRHGSWDERFNLYPVMRAVVAPE